MPKYFISWLVALTVFVVGATAFSIHELDETTLASFGSFLGAAAGFIAVIWFTGGLWYQAQQLREQRNQFIQEFKNQREEGRRNALFLAREILLDAEQRALQITPDIDSLEKLVPNFLKFEELKDIVESEDPSVVEEAIKRFHDREAPALILLRGIKSAAEVYFLSIGKTDIDYSHDPEDFVYIYGPGFWKLPFFERFQGSAHMLSQMMGTIKPGREAVKIAIYGVLHSMGPEKLLKMDEIREEIKRHTDKGYPLPKIAERLMGGDSEQSKDV